MNQEERILRENIRRLIRVVKNKKKLEGDKRNNSKVESKTNKRRESKTK